MNQLELFEEEMISELRVNLSYEEGNQGYTALSLIEEQSGRLYVDARGVLAKVEVNSIDTCWHVVVTFVQENWLLQTFSDNDKWLLQTFSDNDNYKSVVREKQCSVGELYKVLAEMLVCLSK